MVHCNGVCRIDPFPLGADDSSDRLLILRVVRAEHEIDALLLPSTWRRGSARRARARIRLFRACQAQILCGERSCTRRLFPPRGLFAAGKFDQYKRYIPYATLSQASRPWSVRFLVKSEAEVDQWRHTLREAVGPNGQLIVSLIPEVEFIIGKPAARSRPAAARRQNRFQLVFRRFICAFARRHPLALFLDDLQWLDVATLDLLERLVTHPEVRTCCWFGAYRDNEVSPSHSLLRTLETIRKAGARVQEIVLAPLVLDDVGALVSDALHCAPEHVRP